MEALCRLSYPGGIGDDSNVIRRLLPVALAVLLVGCGTQQDCPGGFEEETHAVAFGPKGHETWMDVRLADDPEERAKGLLGVTELGADSGMAFEFGEPVTGTFWMKETLIPLSIAFIGEDLEIVTILEMTPCETDTCPTFAADAPYVQAVEANAGWFADHGIEVGDPAVLQGRMCI